VDAANQEGSRQAAEYLHDTLLLLQKRVSSSKTSKIPKDIPILIAANKMDLFTANPAATVKKDLEVEITKIRTSKSKGLLDSGIGMGDAAEAEDNDDWLGEMGGTEFKFKQMEEFNISVSSTFSQTLTNFALDAEQLIHLYSSLFTLNGDADSETLEGRDNGRKCCW
jgi:hypothetical protein